MNRTKDILKEAIVPFIVMVVLTAACIFLLNSCGKNLGAGASGYKPGTYTAEANGMGTVKVTVNVDDTKITSVDLDVSGETPTIGQAAAGTLKQQIMDAQGAGIDGVSGATVTSSAVKSALMDCLSQAAK